MKFIELKNVNKTYKNGITAIADLSVGVARGEFVFVIGLTASGKSTFIKMLYREEKPTSGTVYVGGLNVGKLRNGKVYKLRRKVGIVFQDFKLLPRLTVYENVAFALECIGMKGNEIRPKVLNALERVGLKEKVRSFPGELSGGEQQRVALARVILKKGNIILADEPTGNLDVENTDKVMKILKKLKEDGKLIIIVTHSLSLANECDDVIRW